MIIISNIINVYILIVFGFLGFLAFLDHSMNFSIFTYTLWYILFFIVIKTSLSSILLEFTIVYMLTVYLKCRFRQVYENIEIRVKDRISIMNLTSKPRDSILKLFTTTRKYEFSAGVHFNCPD